MGLLNDYFLAYSKLQFHFFCWCFPHIILLKVWIYRKVMYTIGFVMEYAVFSVKVIESFLFFFFNKGAWAVIYVP